MTAQVTMRYYDQSDKAEDKLSKVLKTFKGISNIKYPEAVKEDTEGTTTLKKERTVTFAYNGAWKGLVDVEKLTIKAGIPAALMSHAYVAIAIVPTKGFSNEEIRSSLNDLPGMKYVCCVNTTFADFYMDIREMDSDALIKAARAGAARAKAITHETITLTLKEGGDAKGFIRNLLTTMKVLMVVKSGETVTVKSLRSINDERFRRIAQKSGIKVSKIKRKS